MTTYVKISGDRRWGLVGPDADGFHQLVLMGHGTEADEPMGAVADPDNFELAIDVAEEEVAALLAQAREEFSR